MNATRVRESRAATAEPRHQFDMRGVAELVDRGHAFDAGSRHRSGSARRARRSRRCRIPPPPRGLCWRRAAWACACAPCRGGSNTTASKSRSSCGTSGRRNRSRVSALTGFSPDVDVAAFCSARHAAGVAVECRNPRLRGQPQRKGTDAAKQIGDVFGALAVIRHQRRQGLFAGDRGLQERARRQGHLRGADRDGRRRRASAPARHGASAAPDDVVRRPATAS